MATEGEVRVRPAEAGDLELLVGFNAAMARETEDHGLDLERLRAGIARVLADPEAGTEPWILIQALRGLGRLRNGEHAPAAVPYLTHPTPMVRLAAAVSLGYLRNRDVNEALIARLGPVETNANVRLAVRKALQALAGGIDRGYDVKEWRRVFETGSQG